MTRERFPYTVIVVVGALVILMSSLWRDILILTTVLIGLTVLVMYFWHEKRDLTFFFVSFLLGPAVETVSITFGAWSYTNPTYIIPVWLPLVWGLSGISLSRISEYFIKRGIVHDH
jgi:uncharacterized membrane protein YoaT (DUF817 family)